MVDWYNKARIDTLLAAKAAVTALTSGLAGKADLVSGTVPLSQLPVIGDTNALTVGESTIPRLMSTGNSVFGTGNLMLTYFTATKTETITQVRTITNSSVTAGATLCRVGLYTVDSSGNLTLVAATASDTAMWSATYTSYTKALTTSYAKVAGQRYALGLLFVGTTGPRLMCAIPVTAAEDAIAPRINGNITGQTDLPSTLTAASVLPQQGISFYGVVLP